VISVPSTEWHSGTCAHCGVAAPGPGKSSFELPENEEGSVESQGVRRGGGYGNAHCGGNVVTNSVKYKRCYKKVSVDTHFGHI
jgi:hypothetical protein